ncbi:type I phosphodiesterase/nucleotide pyrophosphatase [Novosphingobium sp. Rr 2-17]|uniref:alkaline phosphatase family protein n=1 Tax=Novosphingobium sp. Rr 2-17 TaxID=555793 RepID=UPI0002698EC4|nr:alkaline phosphatase family protein [Novosphingobium sp. Rr 2-17]EIZ79266.1 type I phosphodiesterase/nucleotide pyrophosphatase [Novosphingobium sp. Rr 2-17]
MRPSCRFLGLAAALTIAVPAVAQPAPSPAPAPAPPPPTPQTLPSKPPKLIVAISVDQFSADLFAQYRQHYTKGMGRLLQGVVFASGFQSHAATETCPGHSTLLTGVHPSRTGIIANNWFDEKLGREVYCAEEEGNPKSTADDPVVSNHHLLAPTLGDLLKARNPATLNVAVSAKDRAVVMMSGHTADAGYWFKGKGFTTFADRKVSPAAVAENTALASLVGTGAADLAVPGWCAGVDRATDLGGFTIGTYRFPLKAGDFKGFSNSPRIDEATTDLAVRLLDEMPLGKDDVPDVLSVSYSATDKVGHAYGNEGVEMCIQMAVLDDAVGRLLDALDARGLDYAVVLSADHGAPDAPERMRLQGVADAARLDPTLTDKGLSEAISKVTGITVKSGKVVHGAGGSGDIWVDGELQGKKRGKVIAELVRELKANPQVSGVYTAAELARVKVPSGHPQDWTEIERVAASYNPAHSGEVLMMTKRDIVPGTKPVPGYTSTHGSPWDYDRRVPIVFWRKGITPVEQAQPVETVDIAPTLAALVGLSAPAGTWDGRCLDIYAGEADSCTR